MIAVARLSDMLRAVLAGETVKVPTTVGMSRFYRKAIEDYVLKNTVEPIQIVIAPDQSYISVRKIPQPLPIEDLTK
jgi:hypothetical protein